MKMWFAILAMGVVIAEPALAAPEVATVRVTIGADLASKTQLMDAREFEYLTRELKRSVEKRLDRSGALNPNGGELTLVIEDARPNRPTMREMVARPGLSFNSFGVGGARITGEYKAPSGIATPVDYSWYETDIRWAQYRSTWSDADEAFERLADRFASGKLKDQLD